LTTASLSGQRQKGLCCGAPTIAVGRDGKKRDREIVVRKINYPWVNSTKHAGRRAIKTIKKPVEKEIIGFFREELIEDIFKKQSD
jgi:hypothetical protein